MRPTNKYPILASLLNPPARTSKENGRVGGRCYRPLQSGAVSGSGESIGQMAANPVRERLGALFQTASKSASG